MADSAAAAVPETPAMMTLNEFYEAIVAAARRRLPSQQQALRQHCFDARRKHAAVADKLVLPANVADIVREADAASRELFGIELRTIENVRAFGRQFKQIIVALIVIMAVQRSTKMHARRQKIDAENLRKGRDGKSATSGQKYELPHEDIASEILECESEMVRLAVSMYQRAVRGSSISVTKYNSQRKLPSHSDLFKEHLALVNASDNPEIAAVKRLAVVRACLELSELLRDSRWARMALKLDPERYISAIKLYSEEGMFATIAPFMPLFHMYLDQQTDRRDQLRILSNHFDIDPASTVNDTLDGVCRRRTAADARLDESDACEVFVGPKHFTDALRHTTVQHDGRTYAIVTYHDGLFDVRGVVHRGSGGNVSQSIFGGTPRVAAAAADESALFAHMSWSSRLALVPFRAKVPLVSMTGRQLNEALSSASIDLCGSRGATIYVSRKQRGDNAYEEFSFGINRPITAEG